MKKIILVISCFIAFITCVMAQGPKADLSQTNAARSLYQTELAFASNGTNPVTLKKAFIDNLADHSIVFRPHPVNAKAWYSLAKLDSSCLLWEPEVVVVSKDGQLGFSYGPWRRKKTCDAEKGGNGHYFTIWEKQNGVWKAVLDRGVGYREPYTVTTVKTDQLINGSSNSNWKTISKEDEMSLTNFRDHIDNSTVFFRMGKQPFSATDSIVNDYNNVITWKVIDGKLSGSKDLAYLFGYFIKKNNEQGYYVRVWKLVKTKWIIAVDLQFAFTE